MHGPDPAVFVNDIKGFLGFYYLSLSVMNALAAMYLWLRLDKIRQAIVWLVVSTAFLVLAPLAFSGRLPGLPEAVRHAIDAASGAVTYTLGTTIVLVVLYLGREFFVKPVVAWTGFNLALLLMGLSMANANFASIVTKPDNVPIVGLVFLLGFFTWLATAKAVENDRRHEQGLEPLEKLDNEKVLVWPDLVYTEMICMIALTAFLIVWAIALQAPLEEPASSVKTPNPSKAPWYFLGLQEMLVYYDPWMAGVVLPSLVLFGLMAIPFIDFNKAGNGYYTIKERKFSYIMFQIGFLELWITLIILGTFLRGPNWNFFGPFEYWDPHKVLALNNINLSEFFWVISLNRGLPKAPEGASFLTQALFIVYRESPGILILALYFLLLPPVMAATVFRKFFVRMGFIRYMILANLLLFMAALPLKMLLRWTFNLKYIVYIPEWFLNF
ncbi:MAG: hypothetical protein KF708_08315 [Pirellulales bacterium]|nr:hypothetical protein [Pirellulales bacterium]